VDRAVVVASGKVPRSFEVAYVIHQRHREPA
jgi:hypothetical protein